MRVGVFGGTFDPPHIGHSIVATEVLVAASLDRVLWVPVSLPPHKAHRTITPGDVRRRLVAAAIRDDPRFELCDLELERGGVSYTVDTLRKLKTDHPDWSLSLIVGADLVRGFASWKEPQAITELAEVIVIPRPGADLPSEGDGGPGLRTVPVTPVGICSSQVRQRIERNLAVRDMVAPTVMTIIEGEGLYRTFVPGPQASRGRKAPATEPRKEETGER